MKTQTKEALSSLKGYFKRHNLCHLLKFRNILRSSSLEMLFTNPNPTNNETITLIAQTPSGNSKKLVVKLSQLMLIKKEEFETSLTEIKQENVAAIPLTHTTEMDFKSIIDTKPTNSKLDVKNFEFERKYVVADQVLKEKDLTVNRYPCEVCGKEFATAGKYQRHLEIVHSTRRAHLCSLCGRGFRTNAALQKHQSSHEVTKFVCEYCNKELASRHQLDIHIRRHTGQYSHKCSECGKEYYNVKAFRQHIESEHKGIRYTCMICGSILRSRRYWRDHMAKHTDKDVKRYLCGICNKFYSSKAALNGHMKIHGQERFECEICGKKSTQKAAHLVHMRLHTGEKDFVCEICGKKFVRKDMMQIHRRRTHRVSKHRCEYCGGEFETEHQLLVHYHDHEEVEKNFPCEFCDRKFIDINFLRNHVNRIHVENKTDDSLTVNSGKYKRRGESIKCLYCDKLISKSHVETHECVVRDRHKTLADYSCVVCYEKFENLEAYEQHMHQEHSIKGVSEEDAVMYEFKDDIINSDGMVEVYIGNDAIVDSLG